MKPETMRFLEKAGRLLAEAETMLSVGLSDAAGRTAYLAGFRASQALIFERAGKATKSHNGVQTEFLRLTGNDAGMDGALRGFLSRAYERKSIADYETGPGSEVSPARAANAIEIGRRFVDHIGAMISTLPPQNRAGS